MTEIIVGIARTCHEANRAYCLMLGDTSQPRWEDAPDWQKASAVNGVQHHLLHPDVTPEQSHVLWLAEKTAAGWKWGPIKDAERKEHPCCVPYADLPPAQRRKDALFVAIVNALRPACMDSSKH